jgi:precorrin-6B methylase 2
MNPTLIFLVLFIVFASLFTLSFLRHRARCRGQSYPKRIKRGLKILDKLYHDVNGMEISLADRQRMGNDDPSFTYGEVTFPSIAISLAIAEPKPGEVFYDLGAGAGKAVFCAALLNDWKKCCGIEYLPALYECTQTLLGKLREMPEAKEYFPESLENLQFIQNDILKADFSDADVVYMNATTFAPEFWDLLTPKLEALKSGSRIIVLTKKLDKNNFELIQETSLPMSWGMNSVMIYKRI